MDEIMDELSDAVLYRKLYTNILSQQIQAENRLHRLMMTRKDQAFDEHLAKVRAKVEKDRMRIQKLGERLVLMERKDTMGISRNASKERNPSVLGTLLNMEGLRDQFRFAHNNPTNETTEEMKSNTQRLDSVTLNQSQTVDPKEIEVVFDYPVSQNTNTTPINAPHNFSTKPINNHEHSRKLENSRDYPWFVSGGSQSLKDVLPKRVSFNESPDFIATQKIGNERRQLANQEAGWSSDYSDDEAGEPSQLNPFHKHSTKRYHEPPPDFSQYSYQEKRHVPGTSTQQGRKYNQGLNTKAEQACHENNPTFLKSPEPFNNHEEIWDTVINQENSPFKSPWEGVVSTSLQRQRNDSTQAVPSSTNNKVLLDDLLSGRTTQRNQGTTTTVSETCTTKEISTNTSTTTANCVKTETKDHKKFEEWLNVHKSHDSKQDTTGDFELQYEHVVKSKHDPKFIKDDALTAMRRQSWTVNPPKKKQPKTIGRLASVFRRNQTKNKRAPPAEIVKGDKKKFHVNKKVRRQMSLRPLPETPDVVENEHVLQFTTADSLDTFHALK